MLTREQTIKVIIKLSTEILREKDNKSYKLDSSTPLFGKNGVLDSLSLVRLISDIEENYYHLTGKEIILADEKAMSRSSSPFLTVDTLSDYILHLQDNMK